MSLKDKTINAAFWSFSGNSGAALIRFSFGIFLARILSPYDYGLTGMLAVFIALSEVFVDSGFSAALIQKKEVSQLELSSIFFFNIFIALLFIGILSALSKPISLFFNEPVLRDIIIVLSLGLLFRSFTIVQTTLLVKNLNYKKISQYKMIGVFISGIVALPFAFRGYGVWSLVILTLVYDFCYSILLWLNNQWKPSFIFSFNSIKAFSNYGSRILMVGLLDNFFLHIYKLVIGKYFSANDLGYYTRAYGYRELVSKNLLSVITAVVFPSVATIDGQPDRVKSNFKKISNLSLFISVPLLLLLAFTAEPLIVLMITDKWLPSVPYLKILCLAGIFYPVSGVHISFMKAIGQANAYLWLMIIHKTTIVISVLISLQWGIIGLIYAQLASIIIVFLAGTIYISHYIKIAVFTQILDMMKYVVLGMITFGMIHFLMNNYFNNYIVLVLSQIVLGLSIYLFLSNKMKLSGFAEAVFIFKNVILSRLRKSE